MLGMVLGEPERASAQKSMEWECELGDRLSLSSISTQPCKPGHSLIFHFSSFHALSFTLLFLSRSSLCTAVSATCIDL